MKKLDDADCFFMHYASRSAINATQLLKQRVIKFCLHLEVVIWRRVNYKLERKQDGKKFFLELLKYY